jgi:hypothetical protein
LVPAKCSIIEFIGFVLTKFEKEREALKKAGISIEKSEIENLISDQDVEMCLVYEKKQKTFINREESALAKVDDEVPEEVFTEEESFLDSEGNPLPPEELNMDSKLVRKLMELKRGEISPEFVLDDDTKVGVKRGRVGGTKRAKKIRRTRRVRRSYRKPF